MEPETYYVYEFVDGVGRDITPADLLAQHGERSYSAQLRWVHIADDGIGNARVTMQFCLPEAGF